MLSNAGNSNPNQTGVNPASSLIKAGTLTQTKVLRFSASGCCYPSGTSTLTISIKGGHK